MATPETEATPAPTARTKITVQAVVNAPAEVVWKFFTEPEHIVQWNAPSDYWHTTASTNDLTVGGRFSSTMAAKDGSASFDFYGTYTAVEPYEKIAYTLGDDRTVQIQLTPHDGDAKQTHFVEIFEAESTHSIEMQQKGWQAILDRFKKHVESHAA
jgi:uncharacterized protein YndB with AHSA1/START domain